MIYCFMSSGISLTEEHRTELFNRGRELVRKRTTSVKVKNAEWEVRIRATGKIANLGGVTGVEFEAHIESNRGTGKVRFLVANRDLDVPYDDLEGSWHTAEGEVEWPETEWVH